VRLRVPPNGIARDPEARCHRPLCKPGGDREINLRPGRVIANRAAGPAVGFIGNFSENPDAFVDLADLFFFFFLLRSRGLVGSSLSSLKGR